jgi:mRNA interferase MazF
MAKRTGAPLSGARRGNTPYAPDCGDLIWLTFSPQAGREQAGRRPGLVISPRAYNSKVGLCLVCPITKAVKGYAFEIELPSGLPVQGAILCDHLRSADWQDRQSEFISTVPTEIVDEVRSKLKPLLGI